MEGKSIVRHIRQGNLDMRGLLLVGLAMGWLTGILLSFWLALPPICWLVAAGLALLASSLYWGRSTTRVLALALLCLCLGAWRYTTVAPGNDPAAVRQWLGAGKLTIQGSIDDEPRLEKNTTLLTVTVQSVSRDQGKTWQQADGMISVLVPGATFDDVYGPRYGDIIELAGPLTAPPSYSTPETQASMAFPRLTIKSRDGNPLLVALYQFRTTLAGIILQALPQPFAAILIAIFLSLRTPALKSLLPYFNVTNTAHLVAPSGFKVTLLAGLFAGSTRWLLPRRGPQDWQLLPAERRRGNWQRWLHTGLIMLGIVLYTILSGSGPAALRAGIMGCLLVLAPRLRRTYNVYNALALAALIMSVLDPFVLFDVGFQLSFIGTLGIVILTPFFQHWLRFLTRLPLPGQYVTEVIAVTLAAQVATLPIFAISFQQISFIGIPANILTVPLLGILLGLGALICLSGLLSIQLAILAGWLAYPLLWYVSAAVNRCANLPWAYLSVTNVSPLLGWGYYALLAWLTAFLLLRWRPPDHEHTSPLLSRRTRLVLYSGLALLMLLTTSVMAQAARSDGHLTITVLTSGQSNQGQALLLRTADGQLALFDEGADNSTLAQMLDTQFPFWQRSLSLVVLTDTSAANIAGLQDVISRYSVTQVVDAGMLHPGVAYARWRRTLRERNITYMQVRQGANITLGSQVALQVLWPPAQLHKGSDEIHDNALILRLLAPGLRLLLLNSTSLSKYALSMLQESVAPNYLQAQIVQLSGAAGKTFSPALASVLALANPTRLLITTIPAIKKKQAAPPPTPPAGSWQVWDVGQHGSFVISADEQGWSINST